jgi:hypothetical protein
MIKWFKVSITRDNYGKITSAKIKKGGKNVKKGRKLIHFQLFFIFL